MLWLTVHTNFVEAENFEAKEPRHIARQALIRFWHFSRFYGQFVSTNPAHRSLNESN